MDVYAFDTCEKEFKKYLKGKIDLNPNGRGTELIIGITETADVKELEIIDLARPIMAVKQYYEQILKQNTGVDNEEWLKNQQAEISAFKASLKKLQELGFGVLVNKLNFRDIGWRERISGLLCSFFLWGFSFYPLITISFRLVIGFCRSGSPCLCVLPLF